MWHLPSLPLVQLLQKWTTILLERQGSEWDSTGNDEVSECINHAFCVGWIMAGLHSHNNIYMWFSSLRLPDSQQNKSFHFFLISELAPYTKVLPQTEQSGWKFQIQSILESSYSMGSSCGALGPSFTQTQIQSNLRRKQLEIVVSLTAIVMQSECSAF